MELLRALETYDLEDFGTEILEVLLTAMPTEQVPRGLKWYCFPHILLDFHMIFLCFR